MTLGTGSWPGRPGRERVPDRPKQPQPCHLVGLGDRDQLRRRHELRPTGRASAAARPSEAPARSMETYQVDGMTLSTSLRSITGPNHQPDHD